MITYSLLLEDGSSFSLNGPGVEAQLKNTLTLGDVGITKNSNIVERSYGDGSAKVGNSRLSMGQLTLTLLIAFQDDSAARLYINALFAALKKAVYLVDEVSSLRTRVDLSSPAITWDEGCYLRSGEATISLNQLVPYWEATSLTEVSADVDAGVPETLIVTNVGYAETPFMLTVSVAAQETPVEVVEVQNIAEGRAIIIESDTFGIGGYTLLEVDCTEGRATLVDEVYGAEIDAQDAFVAGAGYFNLFVGSNALELRCSVAATFTFQYRPRFYI